MFSSSETSTDKPSSKVSGFGGFSAGGGQVQAEVPEQVAFLPAVGGRYCSAEVFQC